MTNTNRPYQQTSTYDLLIMEAQYVELCQDNDDEVTLEALEDIQDELALRSFEI